MLPSTILYHVTYASTGFEVTTSKDLGENALNDLQENSIFDLDLGVKVT